MYNNIMAASERNHKDFKTDKQGRLSVSPALCQPALKSDPPSASKNNPLGWVIIARRFTPVIQRNSVTI
jgi:hypothetical protein